MDTLFFRTRDNGAMVFRIDTENRQRRLEMQQIATVNLRSGEIKPHSSQTVIAAAERNEIEKWIVGRRRELNARDIQDVDRLVDQLNWAAQWVQSRATKDQIEEQADPLMMAMHDLRSQIVRKRAGHLD